MSMFETSRWKVGQPTLRVMVILSVLGATSYVLGSCTGRRLPERQEANTQSVPQRCMDGGTPADAGGTTYTPDAGFNPSDLCLKSNAQLEFDNQGSEALTLCFRQRADGAAGKGPFDDGKMTITIQAGKSSKRAHGRLKREIYDYHLGEDGGCFWGDGGTAEEGNAGTLEVGTGGTGEPPELH